jgi:rRNA maturation RNase YbeY
MAVEFFFIHKGVALGNRKKLKLFIASIFKSNGIKLSKLTYIFCSDKYLLKINREFLNHDFYTDIITFTLSGIKEDVEGEIYISVDRVRENARVLDKTFKNELHRVIFHGALHLCGYNDKTKSEQAKMRLAENECLEAYFG